MFVSPSNKIYIRGPVSKHSLSKSALVCSRPRKAKIFNHRNISNISGIKI